MKDVAYNFVVLTCHIYDADLHKRISVYHRDTAQRLVDMQDLCDISVVVAIEGRKAKITIQHEQTNA